MGVPKYLWSDAVLNACHLLNRMPSSVFDDNFFLVSIRTIVFSPRLSVFLVVRALFRNYLLGWINSLLDLSSAFLLGISELKRDIGVIIFIGKYFVFADVMFYECSIFLPTTPCY